MNYYIGTDRYGNYDLAHAGEWKRHKYIRKEGNRYIYAEDLKKQRELSEAKQKYTDDGVKTTNYYRTGSREGNRLSYLDQYQKQYNPYAARQKYQDDGWKRTRQVWKDGQEYHGVVRGYGNRELGAAKRREFETERASDKLAREGEEKRAAADRAAYEVQRRGERQTKLEDRRALERGAAKGQKLTEIRQRGEQQTRDFYERENIHGPRYYNVSKDTPGAIKSTHGSYGTTEHFKLESPKEHAARLREGVQSRKTEARAKRAIKSVARWGAKQVNSVKSYAKSGAELVSGLFNKKKK